MSLAQFKSSLQNSLPPSGLSALAEALWYDGRGNWEKAHEIAQSRNTPEYCLLHAYLHRKEGDIGNAGYWYSRAGRKMPQATIAEEWESLVKEWL